MVQDTKALMVQDTKDTRIGRELFVDSSQGNSQTQRMTTSIGRLLILVKRMGRTQKLRVATEIGRSCLLIPIQGLGRTHRVPVTRIPRKLYLLLIPVQGTDRHRGWLPE